jgi:hypothetical protein
VQSLSDATQLPSIVTSGKSTVLVTSNAAAPLVITPAKSSTGQ